MIDKSRLFASEIDQDAEDSCYAIFNLCKVGIAANDTIMNIDLTKGGFDALFEAIAALAEDAIERIEDEKHRRRQGAFMAFTTRQARAAHQTERG